jgi:hypothetical protein
MRNTSLSSVRTALTISGAVALAAMLALPASTSVRGATPAPEPRAVVVFDHPEKFMDIRIWRIAADEEKDRRAVLAAFRDFIIQRAPAYLPEGYHLSITFTDMRLAGEFPPGGIGDKRVITQHWPPVFVFSWTVTDRSGAVIKTASENLMETAFMEVYGSSLDSGPLHFERAVLDGWMRENLRMQARGGVR